MWPLPTLVVVLAVLAGLLLPRLDSHSDASLPAWLVSLLFGGDPGAARTMLDAVASSLITVTSLTFSLTVVTLQLASSQFSPRLLRTFTRDLFVQGTLALFLGTFAYSLAVLRSVRNASDASDTAPGASAFVPQISVTVAFVLALASVIALVLFLAHLARQIRVETMLQAVHKDASATARQSLQESSTNRATDPKAQARDGAAESRERPTGAQMVTAPATGFLSYLDEEALLTGALETGAVLVIDRHAGDFLVSGTPIGSCWAIDHTMLTPERQVELDRRMHAAVQTGIERTETQDIGYGLRQLTDVAVKALSPGINDPTTAVHALDHTSALLCELARYDLSPRLLRDDKQRVRVILHRPSLGHLLEVAMTQPRHYGAADPIVLGRLFLLLAEVAWHASSDGKPAIATQLSRLIATAGAQDFDDTEIGRHRELAALVQRAMVGEWPRPGEGGE